MQTFEDTKKGNKTPEIINQDSNSTFSDVSDNEKTSSSYSSKNILFILRTNRTFALTTAFTTVFGVSLSMSHSTVQSPYIQALTGSNIYNGYTSAIKGVFNLLGALPAGYIADRYRRDYVLYASVIVGFLSIALHAALFQPFPTWEQNYILLTAGISAVALFSGMVTPAMSAIYHDSIKTGDRAKYESIRVASNLFASTVGPIISILLFACLGNTWEMTTMSLVYGIGMLVLIPALLLLPFFKDTRRRVSECVQKVLEPAAVKAVSIPDTVAESAENKKDAPVRNMWGMTTASIPYLLTFAEVIDTLGGGLAGRFYVVFISGPLGVNPIGINTLILLVPVVGMSLVFFANWVAKKAGRVQTILIFRFIAAASGAAMAAPMSFWQQHRYFFCFLYLIKMSSFVAAQPLMKSIIFDYVPANSRARWASTDNLLFLCYNITAILGGAIIDSWGYSLVFLFSGTFQVAALLPYTPLLGLVLTEAQLAEQAQSQATTCLEQKTRAFAESGSA